MYVILVLYSERQHAVFYFINVPLETGDFAIELKTSMITRIYLQILMLQIHMNYIQLMGFHQSRKFLK